MLPIASLLTDLADQAIVTPLVAIVATALLMQRRWGSAVLWIGAMAGALGATLALKVGVSACGWRVPMFGPDQLDLQSPSGHTAAAAALAGGFASLLAPGQTRVAVAVSVTAAVLIGATRLLLGVHTVADVLVGAAVGLSGALVLARSTRPPRFRLAPMLAAAALAVVVLHGQHLPAEALIQGRGAALMRAALPVCALPSDHPA